MGGLVEAGMIGCMQAAVGAALLEDAGAAEGAPVGAWLGALVEADMGE